MKAACKMRTKSLSEVNGVRNCPLLPSVNGPFCKPMECNFCFLQIYFLLYLFVIRFSVQQGSLKLILLTLDVASYFFSKTRLRRGISLNNYYLFKRRILVLHSLADGIRYVYALKIERYCTSHN